MYVCREKGMSPMLDKRRALHMMQSIYNRCREGNVSREKGMSPAQEGTPIKEIHVSTPKKKNSGFVSPLSRLRPHLRSRLRPRLYPRLRLVLSCSASRELSLRRGSYCHGVTPVKSPA